jgi:hypothetical protein
LAPSPQTHTALCPVFPPQTYDSAYTTPVQHKADLTCNKLSEHHTPEAGNDLMNPSHEARHLCLC